MTLRPTIQPAHPMWVATAVRSWLRLLALSTTSKPALQKLGVVHVALLGHANAGPEVTKSLAHRHCAQKRPKCLEKLVGSVNRRTVSDPLGSSGPSRASPREARRSPKPWTAFGAPQAPLRPVRYRPLATRPILYLDHSPAGLRPILLASWTGLLLARRNCDKARLHVALPPPKKRHGRGTDWRYSCLGNGECGTAACTIDKWASLMSRLDSSRADSGR